MLVELEAGVDHGIDDPESDKDEVEVDHFLDQGPKVGGVSERNRAKGAYDEGGSEVGKPVKKPFLYLGS